MIIKNKFFFFLIYILQERLLGWKGWMKDGSFRVIEVEMIREVSGYFFLEYFLGIYIYVGQVNREVICCKLEFLYLRGTFDIKKYFG